MIEAPNSCSGLRHTQSITAPNWSSASVSRALVGQPSLAAGSHGLPADVSLQRGGACSARSRNTRSGRRGADRCSRGGWYVFSAMVGMARCAVPARVVAGGTNIRAAMAFEGVARLHAARTSQRDVPTTLNTYGGCTPPHAKQIPMGEGRLPAGRQEVRLSATQNPKLFLHES